MEKLVVKGKKKISGNIKISGSKNATLPILAASILNKNKISDCYVESGIDATAGCAELTRK